MASMDLAGTSALQDAIRHLHGCEAVYVESICVHEAFQGKTVWDGEVQVFDLLGHPTPSRCYAWSHATTGQKRRFVLVLHTHPVDSPVAAVRASIASDVRNDLDTL
jgi:hypothetical protein